MSGSLLDVLAPIEGAYEAVIGFDAAAGQARAYFSDPAKAILNSLAQLEPGKGHWLRIPQAGTWSHDP